jgi:signal peptidase I
VFAAISGSLLGCRYAGYQPYQVAGDSMQPKLYPGDKIFADQNYYKTHPLKDGDIIVFRHNDTILIKRVSALPGESIEGKNGTLFRNGVPLQEPYLAPLASDEVDEFATFPKRQIPSGQVFVTGDHRQHSLDSRSEEYGVVHLTDIVGKFASVYSAHSQ